MCYLSAIQSEFYGTDNERLTCRQIGSSTTSAVVPPPVPPPENSAVDVFGPYTITDGVTTRRRSATKKCWAQLFYLFGFPSSTSGATVSHGRHCL